MVQYSSGRSMGYVLCTRLTIGIPDQNIRKLDGTHLSGIQMLGCPAFKWHSKTRPFGIQPLFYHLNTRLVQYLDLHCIPLFELQKVVHQLNYSNFDQNNKIVSNLNAISTMINLTIQITSYLDCQSRDQSVHSKYRPILVVAHDSDCQCSLK